MYLRNLRLWQLMVTCGIARRTEAILPRLTVPLVTTHLVLAHHSPLSIRFRFDERRFDVDGAYNVRYEVIKKRIDKALVHETGERVTQPRKLAIVYSQPAEAVEYRTYLEYLGARGYVTGEIEDLALDVFVERDDRIINFTVTDRADIFVVHRRVLSSTAGVFSLS